MIRLNFYDDGLLITKRTESNRWVSIGQMVDFRTTTTRQFAHQLSQALQEAGVECELNEELLEEVVTGELNIPDYVEDDIDYIEEDPDYSEEEEERQLQEELYTYNEIMDSRELDELEDHDRRLIIDRLEEIRRNR